MDDPLDLPIALRRPRRKSIANKNNYDASPTRSRRPQCTPDSKPRAAKKRVRFSDPTPMPSSNGDELQTTGLTPMVRRTTLSSCKTHRQHPIPTVRARLPRSSSGSNILPTTNRSPIPFSNDVYFVPLCQVLDGRIKRRIRRNGLSEEMNTINTEKKIKAKETKEEIERLKTTLADKDEEILRLHNETAVFDPDRLWELEQHGKALKRVLADRSGTTRHSSSSSRNIGNSSAYDWSSPSQDFFSDISMDVDVDVANVADEEFGDSTMAELACSTPMRRSRVPFPTPPGTSPVAPLTPCSDLLKRQSHRAVQASLPDREKQGLEDELASLQLEVCKLTATLESYVDMTSRLSDKLLSLIPQGESLVTLSSSSSSSSPPPPPPPHPDLEARLAILLETLSNRTAALSEIKSSLGNLGFPGSDAAEIVTSLATSFRTARLELEYLTPGELVLPLTSAGAEVLDMVLARLRELAKKNREADESIAEYHAIELSLRQQLGARVAAMDVMNRDLDCMRESACEKDARIAELETGLTQFNGATAQYARDVSELEALVQRIESELDSTTMERQRQQEALTEEAGAVANLEARLSTAVAQIATLQNQLAELRDAHARALEDQRTSQQTEIAALVQAHGQALATRDTCVAALEADLDRVEEGLRIAHDAARQLRGESAKLRAQSPRTNSRSKEVPGAMRTELERVMLVSEAFLSGVTSEQDADTVLKVIDGVHGGDIMSAESGDNKGPADGSGQGEVSVADTQSANEMLNSRPLMSSDSVKSGNTRKRKRYDSGLGFLDEEDIVGIDV